MNLISAELDKGIMLCDRVATEVLVQRHTCFLGVKKSISNTPCMLNTGEDVDETEVATRSAEVEAIGNVSRVELLKKIHEMEDPYKEVIYLRVFGGLSFAEIGEILGKSENYARVTFYRGKEKLGKEVNINE